MKGLLLLGWHGVWGAVVMSMVLAGEPAHAAELAPAATPGDALPAPSRAPLPAPLPSQSATKPASRVLTASTSRSARLQQVDFRDASISTEARQMARMAFEGGDARGLPFAVVDKKDARLFVFNADGQLTGATPALLGLARGDDLAPNVGEMVATGIPPALRTTPSGRYDTLPGRNLKGEAVIWVDYDAAFAIHRLRPSPASERRAERLASATPEDNRISLGCVIVTGDFFDQVVRPTLGHGAGVVYVLPEPPAMAERPVAMNTAPQARNAARPL
ncbi:hypothetical protein SAMN05216359_11453 [Roseateles sp. YR242]|uniref:hypothetical protein n=1 Tax=Roseateles sp. YR242 TaxID=1855305 RepID=UPI0008AE7E4D|nr:hypothetical protein [Roseateles sp. YR242]SEL70183.1 hypothetical protein SAMN05216359_11453 [Roseateles sp. YR242]